MCSIYYWAITSSQPPRDRDEPRVASDDGRGGLPASHLSPGVSAEPSVLSDRPEFNQRSKEDRVTDYETSIRVEPGYDHRDEGGDVVPLGIIFDLVGPRVRVSWGISTGWVQRPVLTDTLRPGAQVRGNRPGVDPMVEIPFPRPMVVSIVDPSAHPGEPDLAAPDYERYLLEALFAGGAPAVFSILRTIHDVYVV